mgnify:CR=1 FL=1
MFKVIVAGGRDFNNYKGLSDSLDYLLKNINDDIQIVCGMARGADRLGIARFPLEIPPTF